MVTCAGGRRTQGRRLLGYEVMFYLLLDSRCRPGGREFVWAACWSEVVLGGVEVNDTVSC